MARFHAADIDCQKNYDVIDGESGHYRTQGMQGGLLLNQDWNEGDEAWLAPEWEFAGKPDAVAFQIRKNVGAPA